MAPVDLAASFLVAAVVSLAATPVVARVARFFGIVDKPDPRKVNLRENIPLLGGIAVAFGFFSGLVVAMALTGDEQSYRNHIEGQVLGSMLLLALGIVDDRWPLTARSKLVVQILAATVAIAYGFRITHFSEPVTATTWELPPPLMWAASILWIVGITNALNLMDGLDGLATGLGVIIGSTLTVIAWQANELVGVFVGAAFLGALLGFLPFNFPPARIFLGDTGALFVGFNLALLALEGYRKLALLTFVVPLLALAVPLLDTTLSIYRRVRRRASILSPDRQHMHHRLLESAGSHRSAVLSIWFLTACFCVIAVSFTRIEGWTALVFLALVVALTVRMLRNMGFFEVEPPPTAAPEDRSK